MPLYLKTLLNKGTRVSLTKFSKITTFTSLCIEKVSVCMVTALSEAGFYSDVMHYCDSAGNNYYSVKLFEHVDDYLRGLSEITRILKSSGILLLGLPFRQAIHMGKNDYWRFTEHGIRYMLSKDYEILNLSSMDNSVVNFPTAYWVKARKNKVNLKEE